jgi:hypothetical protein
MDSVGGYGLGFDGQVTVRANDAETVALKLLRPRGANEKGDITARLCKTRSEITADCTGSDDKNLHEHLSCKG